jgi:hypothetical protein
MVQVWHGLYATTTTTTTTTSMAEITCIPSKAHPKMPAPSSHAIALSAAALAADSTCISISNIRI